MTTSRHDYEMGSGLLAKAVSGDKSPQDAQLLLLTAIAYFLKATVQLG